MTKASNPIIFICFTGWEVEKNTTDSRALALLSFKKSFEQRSHFLNYILLIFGLSLTASHHHENVLRLSYFFLLVF